MLIDITHCLFVALFNSLTQLTFLAGFSLLSFESFNEFNCFFQPHSVIVWNSQTNLLFSSTVFLSSPAG